MSMTDSETFYILDARALPSDIALWWRAERSGYTTDFAQAGVYSREEAESIGRGRGTDIAVPCEVALARVVSVVSVDALMSHAETRAGIQGVYAAQHEEEQRRQELSERDLQDALECDPFGEVVPPNDVTILHDWIVHAAKPHACHDCGSTIRKGLPHRCRAETCEGKAYNFRWCHDCTKQHVGYPYGEQRSAER